MIGKVKEVREFCYKRLVGTLHYSGLYATFQTNFGHPKKNCKGNPHSWWGVHQQARAIFRVQHPLGAKICCTEKVDLVDKH